ncbi:MAG: DUF378 domain-containing protein [Patescibacteria group bacterium]
MHKVTFILLVIGGLNWLLFGLFGWEVGSLLGGMDSWIAKIVYILVGLSAIYEVATHKKNCRWCAPSSALPGMMK